MKKWSTFLIMSIIIIPFSLCEDNGNESSSPVAWKEMEFGGQSGNTQRYFGRYWKRRHYDIPLIQILLLCNLCWEILLMDFRSWRNYRFAVKYDEWSSGTHFTNPYKRGDSSINPFLNIFSCTKAFIGSYLFVQWTCYFQRMNANAIVLPITFCYWIILL